MNSLFRTARYQPKPAQDGADGDAFAPDCPPPMGLEDYGFAGPITDSYASAAGFPIKRWSEITFDLDEEYLIDGILPRQGVGLLYGASQAFKSFIVVVGPGETSRSALFSTSPQRAARGSVSARPGTSRPGVTLPADENFAVIEAAPNLGCADGDLGRLISTVEGAGIKPGVIFIDTVAKSIGGADENGAGIAMFLVNAQALARGAFRMSRPRRAPHRLDEDAQGRPRGWSGLPAAVDVMILSERKKGEFIATLTLQKSKDDASDVTMTAHLSCRLGA